jgi:hypothetical protein
MQRKGKRTKTPGCDDMSPSTRLTRQSKPGIAVRNRSKAADDSNLQDIANAIRIAKANKTGETTRRTRSRSRPKRSQRNLTHRDKASKRQKNDYWSIKRQARKTGIPPIELALNSAWHPNMPPFQSKQPKWSSTGSEHQEISSSFEYKINPLPYANASVYRFVH